MPPSDWIDADAPRPADALLAEVLAEVTRDPRVRAAVLSGSLADPDAPRDRHQDVDLLLVVDDVEAFRGEPAWTRRFGEGAITQWPDDMPGAAPRADGGFAVLTLYRDGRRLDATFVPRSVLAGFRHDGPSVVLLDRDGDLPAPTEADRRRFRPTPPTPEAFAACCNEFWWVAPYVAKGLARGELAYARAHLDHVLRGELLKALAWRLALEDPDGPGIGKHGRYLRSALDAPTWARFRGTLADADGSWDALAAMADLFHEVASAVAERCGFAYPADDERHVRAHLARLRADATEAAEVARAADAAAREITPGAPAGADGPAATPAVRCRLAAARDLPALAVCDPLAGPGTPRAAQLVAWQAAGRLLVAEVGGAVAGYAALTHDFFGRDFLALLVVAEAWRRRGVGTALVRAAEARARGPRMFTSTNASNLPMQALLTACGYRRSGFVDDLDPGDPEVVYSRPLGGEPA